MFNDGFGPGGGLMHLVGMAIMGIFSLVILVVIVGLIFLLVRFLLVGTTAAQLYISKNSPAKSEPSTAAAKPAAKSTTVTKPAPKAPKP
jgi:predicted lipid-binding transport protein (Tim44 family)